MRCRCTDPAPHGPGPRALLESSLAFGAVGRSAPGARGRVARRRHRPSLDELRGAAACERCPSAWDRINSQTTHPCAHASSAPRAEQCACAVYAAARMTSTTHNWVGEVAGSRRVCTGGGGCSKLERWLTWTSTNKHPNGVLNQYRLAGQQSVPKSLVMTILYSPPLGDLPKHLGGGCSIDLIDSRSSSSESSARLRDVSTRSSWSSSSAGMMLTLVPARRLPRLAQAVVGARCGTRFMSDLQRGGASLRLGSGWACRRSPESAAARDQPRNPKTGRPAVSAAVTRMKTPRSDGCSVAERSWKLA